jgi:hypothetical protein
MSKKKKAGRKAKRRLARVTDSGVQMEDIEVAVVCDKSHTKVPKEVADLPDNQKHPFRHICAGCSYELGYKHGYEAAMKALRQAQPPSHFDEDAA